MDDSTPTTPTQTPTAAPDEAEVFALATQRYAAGDAAGAMELLPALVAAHPQALSVRLLVARCGPGRRPRRGPRRAEAAVACDPSSWEAQVLVAQALVDVDADGATAAAARAVHLAPSEPAAVAVQTQVRAAVAAAAATAAAPAPGLGARFGVARPGRPDTAPVEATPAPLLPPVAPERPRERPIRLPAALREGNAPGPAATEPTAEPAPTDDIDAPAAEEIAGWRAGVRVLGLVLWVYLGFRYGVQVIGGPIGIGLFLAMLAGAGYATRWLKTA